MAPKIFLIALFCLSFPFFASADIPLLRKHITAYNLEHHKSNLSDLSYRGEEGILKINPEIGQLLGLKVLINQDYINAVELYKEAEALFEKAINAMTTQDKESYPGEYTIMVAETAVQHNKMIELARQHMMAYHLAVTDQLDERLNDERCSSLLEKLLEEDLQLASYNLRDALGKFYNRCQGIDSSTNLNLENIAFVNYVFHEFTKNASKETLSRFDIDRSEMMKTADSRSEWKAVLGNSSSRFSPLLEDVFEKYAKTRYPVDELLFLALIWQESNYNPRNVSYVGAAGLTQIMPKTAKSLGMKNIFEPDYFKEAGSLLGRERKLKNKAKNLLLEITEENSISLAKQARDLMQEALDCGKVRKELYARYKKELLKFGTDDRLDPLKALDYGFKYFSQMMEIQKGDISLALAAYNAGPHRIKQYKGIPPFEETIDFRNKVLKFYGIYRSRITEYRLSQKKTH